MKKTKIDHSQALFKTADAQMGYFTSQQAEECGLHISSKEAFEVLDVFWEKIKF